MPSPQLISLGKSLCKSIESIATSSVNNLQIRTKNQADTKSRKKRPDWTTARTHSFAKVNSIRNGERRARSLTRVRRFQGEGRTRSDSCSRGSSCDQGALRSYDRMYRDTSSSSLDVRSSTVVLVDRHMETRTNSYDPITNVGMCSLTPLSSQRRAHNGKDSQDHGSGPRMEHVTRNSFQNQCFPRYGRQADFSQSHDIISSASASFQYTPRGVLSDEANMASRKPKSRRESTASFNKTVSSVNHDFYSSEPNLLGYYHIDSGFEAAPSMSSKPDNAVMRKSVGNRSHGLLQHSTSRRIPRDTSLDWNVMFETKDARGGKKEHTDSKKNQFSPSCIPFLKASSSIQVDEERRAPSSYPESSGQTVLCHDDTSSRESNLSRCTPVVLDSRTFYLNNGARNSEKNQESHRGPKHVNQETASSYNRCATHKSDSVTALSLSSQINCTEKETNSSEHRQSLVSSTKETGFVSSTCGNKELCHLNKESRYCAKGSRHGHIDVSSTVHQKPNNHQSSHGNASNCIHLSSRGHPSIYRGIRDEMDSLASSRSKVSTMIEPDKMKGYSHHNREIDSRNITTNCSVSLKSTDNTIATAPTKFSPKEENAIEETTAALPPLLKIITPSLLQRLPDVKEKDENDVSHSTSKPIHTMKSTIHGLFITNPLGSTALFQCSSKRVTFVENDDRSIIHNDNSAQERTMSCSNSCKHSLHSLSEFDREKDFMVKEDDSIADSFMGTERNRELNNALARVSCHQEWKECDALIEKERKSSDFTTLQSDCQMKGCAHLSSEYLQPRQELVPASFIPPPPPYNAPQALHRFQFEKSQNCPSETEEIDLDFDDCGLFTLESTVSRGDQSNAKGSIPPESTIFKHSDSLPTQLRKNRTKPPNYNRSVSFDSTSLPSKAHNQERPNPRMHRLIRSSGERYNSGHFASLAVDDDKSSSPATLGDTQLPSSTLFHTNCVPASNERNGPPPPPCGNRRAPECHYVSKKAIFLDNSNIGPTHTGNPPPPPPPRRNLSQRNKKKESSKGALSNSLRSTGKARKIPPPPPRY